MAIILLACKEIVTRVKKCLIWMVPLHFESVCRLVFANGTVVAGMRGPSLLFPHTHILRDVCFLPHISLMHQVLQVIVKYVSPGILLPHLRFANSATTQLHGQLPGYDIIRQLYIYQISPNNKGSPTVVKSCYTLVHTVCMALMCMVLPEIIIPFKAEINKTCSV